MTPLAAYRDITPAQLLRAGALARLIDVREPDELVGTLGRIADAENVPLAMVEAAARTWDKDAEIVLICRSGGRSARAAEALVRAGFRRVMNLAGGMLAYTAAGLPTAS